MKRAVFLFSLVIFLLPFFAGAKVVINEIGWAGTKASASDEWLELFNSLDSDVSLEGWILRAKTGSPTINLSGKISGRGFYLIERTADSTISDVSGDYVGSFGKNGSLSNSGEDLELVNSAGVIEDNVYFSSGWPAGSASPDYVSMERVSALRDGSDSKNWKSNNGVKINGRDAKGNNVLGTPKAENSVYENLAQDEQNTSAVNSNSDSKSGGNDNNVESNSILKTGANYDSKQFFKENNIKVYAGEDKTAVVGADVNFTGRAAGLKNTPLDPVKTRFIWNFGDGASSEGNFARHSFAFPGNYIVFLDVASGEYSSSDKLLVKVLPNNILISEVSPYDSWIELYNGAEETLDISLWQIFYENQKFIFPKNTFIRGKSYITLPKSISNILIRNEEKYSEVSLLYPNNFLADKFIFQGNVPENKSFSFIKNKISESEKTPGEINKALNESKNILADTAEFNSAKILNILNTVKNIKQGLLDLSRKIKMRKIK